MIIEISTSTWNAGDYEEIAANLFRNDIMFSISLHIYLEKNLKFLFIYFLYSTYINKAYVE